MDEYEASVNGCDGRRVRRDTDHRCGAYLRSDGEDERDGGEEGETHSLRSSTISHTKFREISGLLQLTGISSLEKGENAGTSPVSKKRYSKRGRWVDEDQLEHSQPTESSSK